MSGNDVIKKALECNVRRRKDPLYKPSCTVCDYHSAFAGCRMPELLEDAVDLIVRQEAENERLEKASHDLENCFHRMDSLYHIKCMELKVAKAEAYKEFAEMLKAESLEADVSYGYGRECWEDVVTVKTIEEIAKEMTGERE